MEVSHNTATNISSKETSLESVSMRETFLDWLITDNSKTLSPHICVTCLDKISEYTKKKKIYSTSLWEITQPSVFEPIHSKIRAIK